MPAGAPSKIGLLSAALTRIGQQPISSVSGTEAEQISANARYALAKRDALRRYWWTFAMRETALASMPDLGSQFTDEFTYAFKQPADLIRAWGIVGDNPRARFKLFGDELYTDVEAPRLLYCASVDEAYFSPDFAVAFEMQLAADLCYAITGDLTLRRELTAEARIEWRKAMSADGQSTFHDGLEGPVRDLLRRDTSARM